MVSSIDPKEESWNQLQRQLSNQRKTREVKRTGGGVVVNNNQNKTLKKGGNNNSSNNVKFSNINNEFNPSRDSVRTNNVNNNDDNRPIRPAKYTYVQSPNNNKNRFQNNNNNNNTNSPINTNNNINNNNNNNTNFYNTITPVNTPPRLRALQNNSQQNDNINSNTASATILPGISPYTSARNYTYNEIPNLESWGITNNQPRNNDDFYSLYRYNPSPLIPIHTQSYLNKERKPYMVVPNLRRSYFDSPSFTFDDPTLHYNYIQSKPYSRPVQFSSLANRIERATDEYDYFKTNTAFSQHYIDEFISKTLQDQIIPDILIETIANVKRDYKLDETRRKNFNDPLKHEATQLLLKVNQNLDTHQDKDLFSTKFIEELDYRAKIPAKVERVRPRKFEPEEELVDIYIQQIKNNVNTSPEPLVHLRSPIKLDTINVNHRNDITELILEDEKDNFDQLALMELFYKEEILEPTLMKMYKEISQEVLSGYKKQVDLLQQREIKKSADEHLLDTLTLDHLLTKMASHGRLVAENDDVNKLIDTMMIDILLYTHSDVRKIKSKTLNNYPLKKFHLNSFMNVALDALVGELSASLEDDMQELEIDEKKFLFPR